MMKKSKIAMSMIKTTITTVNITFDCEVEPAVLVGVLLVVVGEAGGTWDVCSECAG